MALYSPVSAHFPGGSPLKMHVRLLHAQTETPQWFPITLRITQDLQVPGLCLQIPLLPLSSSLTNLTSTLRLSYNSLNSSLPQALYTCSFLCLECLIPRSSLGWLFFSHFCSKGIFSGRSSQDSIWLSSDQYCYCSFFYCFSIPLKLTRCGGWGGLFTASSPVARTGPDFL